MGQYSEMMGSFIRTGSYPIEANYIFNSKEELEEFYSDELNRTTLHQGLFKIVVSGDTQTLYWVTQVDGELQFRPLIQAESITTLFEKITQLRHDLNQEIEERKTSIIRIVGTDNMSDFEEGLDNLLSISNNLIDLKQKSTEQSKTIQAIIGTNQEDLVEYLKGLNYGNLTKISELLHIFFDTINQSGTKISTLPELQQFLEGFDQSCTLKQFLRNLVDTLKHRDNNLQTELNQTQIGVGLDGDGLYSPDQETNYLKNATSVMNALRTLDAKVKEALNSKLTVIDKGYYDPSREAIIISFVGDDTEYSIPASDLITEWNIENTPDSAIKLEKTRVVEGGPDLLRADIILDSSIDNILEKKGNKLLVNGKLLLKYIEFGEDRKTLQLDNYDTISGKDTNGAGHNLAMVSKWNKADFGSPGLPINLNGNEERPTYNDTKEIALLNDLTKFITEDEASKQYLTKDELDWYEG